jgi:hypothetical protein
MNVIRYVDRLHDQGKRLSISWIKAHNVNKVNDRTNAFAGHTTQDIQHSTSSSHQVSIAWMKHQVSESYSEAEILELHDRGKYTIISLLSKKSAMDQARNGGARISLQLRTNH